VTVVEPVRAPGTTARTTWFPLLDTLRAVGAVAVLTTHTAFWAGTYTGHGWFGSLLARLDVGVALFFVLSGFLLARPHLLAATEGRSRPSTATYLSRRFWRITPLAVLAVGIALVLLHDNRDLTAGERVAALTLTSSYVGGVYPAGITHLWSLGVEVAFYVVLPLLMLVGLGRSRTGTGLATPRGRRRVGLLLAAMAGASVAWYLVGVEQVSAGSPTEWLPGFLSWFAVGIGLAFLSVLDATDRGGRVTAAARSLARQPGACWTIAAGLLLVGATPLAGPTMLAPLSPTEHVVKNLLYAVVAGLVVLTGVFPSTPGYARLLGNRFARRVGVVSYGIFCLHLPILHGVMFVTGWELFGGHLLGIWALTLVLSYAAAELAYRWVEAPAQRFARRSSPTVPSPPVSVT